MWESFLCPSVYTGGHTGKAAAELKLKLQRFTRFFDEWNRCISRRVVTSHTEFFCSRTIDLRLCVLVAGKTYDDRTIDTEHAAHAAALAAVKTYG